MMLSKCLVCREVIDVEKYKDRLCSDVCRKKHFQDNKDSQYQFEFCRICGQPARHIRVVGALRLPACPNPECEKAVKKEYYRNLMQYRRYNIGEKLCAVKDCGFKLTRLKTFSSGKEYYLCPNHKLLIETEMETLETLGL